MMALIFMKAEVAIQKTTDNAITTDKMIENIDRACLDGRRYVILIGIYLNFDVMRSLMDLGYKIGSGDNPFGDSFIKIEW